MKQIADNKLKLNGRKQQLGVKNFGTKLLLIFIVFLVVSCQDVKEPVKPENLIPKEKMTTILVDVYISNAARSVNNKLLVDKGVKLDSMIYEKYQIDSLQFVASNNFYSSNLNSYRKIIMEVEARLKLLSEEKDSIYDIIKKENGDTITGDTKYNPLIDPVESVPSDSLQLKSLK